MAYLQFDIYDLTTLFMLIPEQLNLYCDTLIPLIVNVMLKLKFISISVII